MLLKLPFFGKGDVPQGRGNAVWPDDGRGIVDEQRLHLIRFNCFITGNFQSETNMRFEFDVGSNCKLKALDLESFLPDNE